MRRRSQGKEKITKAGKSAEVTGVEVKPGGDRGHVLLG